MCSDYNQIHMKSLSLSLPRFSTTQICGKMNTKIQCMDKWLETITGDYAFQLGTALTQIHDRIHYLYAVSLCVCVCLCTIFLMYLPGSIVSSVLSINWVFPVRLLMHFVGAVSLSLFFFISIGNIIFGIAISDSIYSNRTRFTLESGHTPNNTDTHIPLINFLKSLWFGLRSLMFWKQGH